MDSWYIDDGDMHYEVPGSISQDDHEAVMEYLSKARQARYNNFAQTGQVQAELDTPVQENKPGFIDFVKGVFSGDVAMSDIGKGLYESAKNAPDSLMDWEKRMNSQDTNEREQAALEGLSAVFLAGRGGNLEGGPGVTGMFVGPKGRFTSQGKTDFDTGFEEAWQKKLDANQVAEKKGMTKKLAMQKAQKEMWQEHGAFKGPDGGWRTEINDDYAGIKPEVVEQANNKVVKTTLGESFDHPELFQNYPELKKLPLHFEDLDPGLGGYFDGTKIVINRQNKGSWDSTALHEIQHYIQADEKWARGGPGEAKNYLLENIQDQVNVFEKALRDKVGFKYNTKNADYVAKNIDPKFANDAEYAALKNAWEKSVRLLEDIRGTDPKSTKAKNMYYRLYGEIEARNVERRRWGSDFLNKNFESLFPSEPNMSMDAVNSRLDSYTNFVEGTRRRANPEMTQDRPTAGSYVLLPND